MKEQNGRFRGANRFDLFWQSWLPEAAARGVVVLVHGLGEHSGRYQHVAAHLVAQGFAVYAFDHRGHGRSPDRQCAHLEEWADYRTDLSRFLELVRGEQGERPLFLYGHSMGGLIVLNFALHQPQGLAGVVASAPAVSATPVPTPLRLAALALSRLRPQTSFDNGLAVEGLSRDTAVVEAYQKDPLVHDQVSARWFVEFDRAIDWTQAHAHEFQPPLLIIHGAADQLVTPDGSARFYENVTQTDKQRIVYPDGYHEPHNDLQQEQVLADVTTWLTRHL